MSTRPTERYERSTPPPPIGQSDLDLATLAIAAVASAAAAFVTSQVWPAGTLWSAAASPVIVALVKEGLRRPANRLQTVRRDLGGRLVRGPAAGEDPEETGPVRIYGRSALRSRRWRLAVVTGLLAFAGVAVAYTVPELVAGRSIGGGGDKRTTLFGGKPSASKTKKDASEKSSSKPGSEATPAPQATSTPAPGRTATPTPTPTARPTPAPTVGAAPTASPPAATPPPATPTP